MTTTQTTQDNQGIEKTQEMIEDLENSAWIKRAAKINGRIVLFVDGMDTHAINRRLAKHNLGIERVEAIDSESSFRQDVDTLKVTAAKQEVDQ